MESKIECMKEKSMTLFEEVEQLLGNSTKIGVLVIDEDNRSPHHSDDDLVSMQQEKVIEFAVKYHLPIWFIETGHPTRRELKAKVKEFDSSFVTTIQKADANGFGDGYSWHKPHFADTGLHNQLQGNNITHLIVMGFHVHSCVQVTVGAQNCSDYGKGALHYGYQVITSGDILRSSATKPAGVERCLWKKFPGVSYYDSIKSDKLTHEAETTGQLKPIFSFFRQEKPEEETQESKCQCIIS